MPNHTDPKAIDISPEAVASVVADLLRVQANWPFLGSVADLLSALSAALSEARGKVGGAERERDGLRGEKRAPVQGYSAGIPWSMHLRAYDAYSKKWSPQPAMIDLEGRNCRGGFSTGELDDFIPGWRDELSEMTKLKAERDAALSELAKLRAEAEWRPIETVPSGEEIFMAATAHGRIMIVRGSILATMMKRSTPDHLQFPAVAWKPLPSPLKDPAK